LLLVLGAFRGHTQAPPPPAAPTHADSVATLQQVFRHARRQARFGAGASGVVLGVQALSFASDRNTGTPACLVLGVSVSALYTYFLADRALDWGRFSRRREAEAVRRLEAHQPQPGYVQHRLVVAFKKSR